MRKALFEIPENKRIRVILDTDAGAEADDQFAIVHALLSPKFDVVGIVAEQFGGVTSNSMEVSYQEICRVLEIMDLDYEIPVLRGEKVPIGSKKSGFTSEGIRFIINEALKEDPRPLFVLNMGAITNLAAAYLECPEIENHLVAVWIGGGAYPSGGMDFNLANDLEAANTLIGSEMEFWQIPLNAYTMMGVSFYELNEKVNGYGEIGCYLMEQLFKVNQKECALNFDNLAFMKGMSKGSKTIFIRSGESWSLGDSPAVGVLVTPQLQGLENRKAQWIKEDGSYGDIVRENRLIQVYHLIDSRSILEDFYAKLHYHYKWSMLS